MDRSGTYYRQVQLLIRLFPIISREPCFALKGGTALNLFVRDLPRLSVDIDLVYLPLDERDTAIANVRQAMTRIAKTIREEIPGSEIIPTEFETDALRMFVGIGLARVKVELSPVLRGSVFAPVIMTVRPAVENEFGFAEMPVLALPDLYAGKICAALDRQHPRDLFDLKLLFENEGLTPEIRRTFLVYLISHNRPISELIEPARKNIRDLFKGEFQSMTVQPVTVEELEQVRELLISTIQSELSDAEKDFLVSFKAKKPDWSLLRLENVDQLPAVKWKLMNLEKMSPARHAAALDALRKVLRRTASSRLP
jgi:predicted nucleotidyltransferase component of viral defense system